MSVHYVIHTDPNTFYARHAQTDTESLNNRSRGDTARFDLAVPQSDFIVPSGSSQAVKNSEFVVTQDLIVENNATLDVDGTIIAHGQSDVKQGGTLDTQDGTVNVLSGPKDPQKELLKFDRHAGSYSRRATLDNTQRYKEQLPSNPNINSLVVGLEPATGLQNDELAGKWGLISNVTDNRTRALTNPVVSLEIEILADYSEYSDVTSVQNDLGI